MVPLLFLLLSVLLLLPSHVLSQTAVFPAIYSISPQNRPADSASAITIYGNYAGSVANLAQVVIKMTPPNELEYSTTVPCTIVKGSAFTCQFNLPSRGTGKVPISFTIANGNGNGATPLPRWGPDDLFFTDAPVRSQDRRLCTAFWNAASGASSLGWSASMSSSRDLLCVNIGFSPLNMSVAFSSGSAPSDSLFDLPQTCLDMSGAGSIWSGYWLCIPTEVQNQYTFAFLAGSQIARPDQVCVPLIKSSDSNWNGQVRLCSNADRPYAGDSVPYYQYQVPQITDYTPKNGECAGGLTLTFTGTSFGMNAASIAPTIGGNPCTSVIPTSVNSFTCLSPAGEGPIAGKNPVIVTVGGQVSLQPFDFRYNNPVVNSYSASVTLSTAGGATITVSGRNFGTTFGTVSISHPSIQSFCNIISQTNTQIRCTLPSGVGNNIPLFFQTNFNLGSVQSNSIPFTYAPPVITSITPALLSTNLDTLTIIGDSFGPGGAYTGPITIFYPPTTINGLPAPPSYQCTNPSWGHNLITCRSAGGSGSRIFVNVTVFGGQTSLPYAIGFGAPVITSFSPAQANPYGGGAMPTITIYGNNFGISANGHNYVLVGNQPCASIITYNTFFIVCRPQPPSIIGNGPNIPLVIVARDQNSTWSSSWLWPREFGWVPNCDFQYSNPGPKPTINGPIYTATRCQHLGNIMWNGSDAPSNWDTILATHDSRWYWSSRFPVGRASGNGYTPARIVSWNPVTASLSFELPEGSGVWRNVFVYTNGVIPPQYMHVQAQTWWYDLPVIDRISPTNGSSVGGFDLTVFGRNFGPDGASSVAISSLNCPVKGAHTHFMIICTVPLGSGANNTVFVRTSGQQNLESVLFSYNAPTVNTINGIFPTNGPTAGGYPVTIFGTGFTAGTIDVTFGPTQIQTSWLPATGYTQAIVTCPPGRSKVNVIVTVTKQSSNVITFTYDPPLIQGVSPASTDSAGGNKITIMGISFGSESVSATLGGSPCTPGAGDTVNNTMFVCVAPAGYGINPIVLQSENGISNPFSYPYSNPVVTSLSVSNGPTAGGPLITIFGNSFGSATGQVFINTSFACVHNAPGASWSHTQIVCGLPAGEGVNLPIIVIANGVSNFAAALAGQGPKFSYDPPRITNTEASSMPTNGGSVITIRGFNFGFRGRVLVNGTFCPYLRSPDHTLIQCILPPGQGPRVPIVVQVIINTPFLVLTSPNNTDLSYDPPVLAADSFTSVGRNNGPTVGNTLLTIRGTNFADTGFNDITIGPYIVPRSSIFLVPGSNKTLLAFRTPTGVGRNLPVRVTCASLPFTGTAPLFNFDAPNITMASGCVDVGSSTTRCPLAGGIAITLTGSNFGSPVFNATSAFIRNLGNFNNTNEILPLNVTGYSDNRMIFILPLNLFGGYSLPIVIVTGGQSGEAGLLSYLGPTFKPGSIRYWNTPSNGPAPLIPINMSTNGVPITLALNNTFGFTQQPFNRRVIIQGTFFGNDSSRLIVRYGLNSRDSNATDGSPRAFSFKTWDCPVEAVFQNNLPTGDSYLVCRLSTGIGLNLALQVQVGIQFSVDSDDRISYPRPILVPGTLRYDNVSAGGQPRQVGSSSIGDIVFFQADHLGVMPTPLSDGRSYLTATLHQNGSTSKVCTDLKAFLFNGVPTISCNTRAGFGDGWTFRLFPFGLQYMGSLPTPNDDVYDYVKNPEIRRVLGCQDRGNGTINCPTVGRVPLTMEVDFLGSKLLTVRIGAHFCGSAVRLNDTFIRCILPAGAGLNVGVMVITGQQYSRVMPLVSYRLANITSVSGCPANDATGTRQCNRNGGDVISLTGNDFGPPTATVVVAGRLCKNVTQSSHTSLTCIIESGTGTNQPVLLMQKDGAIARAPQSLSYFQCQPGFYSVVDDLNCYACPPGTFSDNEGLYSCKPCSSGRFTAVNQSTSCSPCLEGTFSRLNDSRVGPIQCEVCPVGRAISVRGSDSCAVCPAGTYQPGNNPSACLPCSAGRFSSSDGASGCSDCPLGRFTTLSGQQFCASCDRGFFGNETAATRCYPCPAGTISDTAAPNCTLCDPGRYNPSTRQSACLFCDVGTYSASPTGFGSQSCLPCQAGKSTNNQIGLSACADCSLGFNASFTGLAACSACPQGYFANVTGQLNCQPCAPTFYSRDIGASSCSPCETGKYSTAVATVDCLNCLPGAYMSRTGASLCDACEAGKFQPDSGKDFCFMCPGGRFQVQSGQVECSDCVPGFYQNVSGQSECSRCQPGSFSVYLTSTASPIAYKDPADPQSPRLQVIGVRGQAECTLCALGSSLTSAGGTSCISCDYGQYADSLGSSVCKVCQPGFAAGSQGLSSCLSCDPGRFSESPSASLCGSCDVGKFANAPSAATACVPCPVGSHQDRSESTSCTNCTAGQFAGAVGTIDCSVCAPGQYSPTDGASTCFNCEPGSFASQPQSPSCTLTFPGYFVNTPGASFPNECNPGTYSFGYGNSSCEQCPPGSFQPDSGQTFCSPCAPGSFADQSGLPNCKFCERGFFSSSYGQVRCDPAPIGQFQSEVGQNESYFCPIGTAQQNEGQASCYICQFGTYSSSQGSVQCIPCQFGKFSTENTRGVSSCSDCNIGSHQDSQGQPGCKSCPLGKFGNQTGLRFCDDCPPGFFQSLTNQTICSICQIGRFASVPGQPACDQCAAGTYTDQLGTRRCANCDAGRYQINVGQSFCVDCKAGRFAGAPGAVECTQCERGKFSANDSAIGCDDCTPGRFQGEGGKTGCEDCPEGQQAPQPRSTSCTLCIPGTFSGSRGTGSCEQCSVGTYNTAYGQSKCSDCAPGRYISTAGQTGCLECRSAGPTYYAPYAGAAECLTCPPNSEPNEMQTKCLCAVGYALKLTNRSNEQSGICVPCPRGAVCKDRGLVWDELQAERGFWEAGNKKFYICQLLQQCPGGYPDTVLLVNQFPRETVEDAKRAMADSTLRLPFDDSLCVNLTATKCSQNRPDELCCPRNCRSDRTGTYRDNNGRREEIINCVSYGVAPLSSCPPVNTSQPQSSDNCCKRGYELNNGKCYPYILEATLCPNNRAGPLCSMCLDGYIESFGGICIPCPQSEGRSTDEAIAIVVLIIVTVVAVVLGAYWLILFIDRHIIEMAVEEENHRRHTEAGYLEQFEVDFELDQQRYERIFDPRGPPPIKPNHMSKVKILITFAQIVSNLAINIQVGWPNTFKEVISWLTPFNFDFIQVSSAGCIVDTQYYNKLILVSIGPVVIVALIFLFYFFPQMARFPLKKDFDQIVQRKMVRKKTWKLILFTIFVIYPFVSSTILSIFNCQEIVGFYYLRADFRLHCFDDKWNTYAALSPIFILLYPVGIPIFVLSILWRYRKRLDELGVRAQFGFMYDAYDRNVWWFECLDNIHKLWLVSLISFFPLMYQMPIGMAVSGLFLFFLLTRRPYVRPTDDFLALLSESEVFLLLMSGNTFLNESGRDSWTDVTLSVVLIGVVFGFFGVFFYQVFDALIKFFRRWQERRRMQLEDEDVIKEREREMALASSKLSAQERRSMKMKKIRDNIERRRLERLNLDDYSDMLPEMDRAELRRNYREIDERSAGDGQPVQVNMTRNPFFSAEGNKGLYDEVDDENLTGMAHNPLNPAAALAAQQAKEQKRIQGTLKNTFKKQLIEKLKNKDDEGNDVEFAQEVEMGEISPHIEEYRPEPLFEAVEEPGNDPIADSFAASPGPLALSADGGETGTGFGSMEIASPSGADATGDDAASSSALFGSADDVPIVKKGKKQKKKIMDDDQDENEGL